MEVARKNTKIKETTGSDGQAPETERSSHATARAADKADMLETIDRQHDGVLHCLVFLY